MTMHPDTRAPIPHVERLAHHIDTTTHRVRIIEAAPDWPAPHDDEQAGAMALAAYVVIAMSAAFGLLAYVALRVAGVV